MNDALIYERKRGRTMLVVEGRLEKDTFFKSVLYSFPELDIDPEDIVVYGTNIYNLINNIKDEYGDRWYDDDIDIPFVYSVHEGIEPKLYKADFKNIFLIFDFERQDPFYDEESIRHMNEVFNDASDNGRLFLNYPMLESYMDADINAEKDKLHPFDKVYMERKASVSGCIGKIYKNSIRYPELKKLFSFKNYLENELKSHSLGNASDECLNKILENKNADEMTIKCIFEECGYAGNRQVCCQIAAELNRQCKGWGSYREKLRWVILRLIYNNICKASMIQFGNPDVSISQTVNTYNELESMQILLKQIQFSQDNKSGFVYALNTGLFIVPDYNSNLISDIT
ncbi:MAG: hypothetical protein IKZ82_14050 [Clostridia bacterium]|nr:hypothetical protein [Clostridia bacterium]